MSDVFAVAAQRPSTGSAARLSDLPLDGLADWLARTTDDPGPFRLEPLGEGTSHETLLVGAPGGSWVLRRPPGVAGHPGAQGLERELRVAMALADTHVPVARPLGLCRDEGVAGAPFLLMDHVDGVSVTDTLPDTLGDAAAVGDAVVDALADLHTLPWEDLGLRGFGRPEGFLERQVQRWSAQFERNRHRALEDFDVVAGWLAAHRPPAGEPGILHGDFHVDNCLLEGVAPVRVAAILDWEMATIGDPLLDVGLLLALWGPERCRPIALPALQGFSRAPGAPSRAQLVARYERRSGRSLEHLTHYMVLALWKLAAVTEGLHAQHVNGTLDTPLGEALERDVPRLLAEARELAGV